VYGVKGNQIAARMEAWAFGMDSVHGFKSIFRGEDARTTILTILDYMIDQKGLAGLKPEPDLFSSPRYACVLDIQSLRRGTQN